MKRKHIYIIGFIIVLGIFACSKERGPHLSIYVHESNGLPAVGAEVHVWPGNDSTQGNGSGIVNEEGMDQIGFTDGAGNISFDFQYSAVLDIDVIYYKYGVDSLLNPITDTLTGSTIAKIEAKRQRSKENNFSETVIVE